jgi:hypothetical protein
MQKISMLDEKLATILIKRHVSLRCRIDTRLPKRTDMLRRVA